MRNPPGDGANQRSTRRRDQAPDRDSQPRRAPAAGSVFAPGYDPSSPAPPDDAAAGPRPSSPGTSWYGSTAGGAVGKGPVRGYPPVPGQPPPMYPPGQFAAWNRQRPGQGRASGQPTGSSGPHTGPGAVRPGLDRPDNGYPGSSGSAGHGYPGGRAADAQSAASQPHARPTSEGRTTARYYDQDPDSGTDPGYPMLAVSDPAADVTSTQTWQPVGEGRATGVWTAPARSDLDRTGFPGRSSADGGGAAAIPRRPEAFDKAGLRTGPDAPGILRAGRDSGSNLRDPAGRPGDVNGDAAGPAEAGRRTSRGHSGAHTSPHLIPRSQRRAGGAPRSDESKRPAGPQPRRKRAASVKLAMATAAILVLAAAAALSYAVLHHSGGPAAAASGARKSTSPSVSASPTPSLGLYGHIATRKSDPAPLTMSELYPTSFTIGGTRVVRTVAKKGTDCASELVGSRILSAVGSAGCSQVVRATYLASGPGVMGTIGVLNLSTAKAATTLERAADANDFISQLAGPHGATTKIGQGTGIEEAAAKGHYLILIWAEFTNLRKPRTPAQVKTVVQFMNELLQHTANVSLTNRMLTGTP